MKNPVIVVLDGFTANPGDLSWESLEKLGSLQVYDRTPPELVVERGREATFILTNKVVLGEAEIAALPKVKYIGVLATGYNNVAVDFAKRRGITVCNVPAYSTEAVAQHVFALILALLNRVEKHNNDVCAGGWQQATDWHYTLLPIRDLAGMTIGIYGLGAIGKAVARLSLAFGMRVIASRQNPKKGGMEGVAVVDTETLLAESDILTLHAPLTAENHGFINKHTLRRMKAGSLLINTGRGGLIHEADLAQALTEGVLSGAGLDVLDAEPPRNGSPLIGIPTCLITPHIAWASVASRRRLIATATENIRSFLNGVPINTIK